MYKINITKKAKKDLEVLSKNKKLIIKALLIIDEICINPYNETYQFERLKHQYTGFCSGSLR